MSTTVTAASGRSSIAARQDDALVPAGHRVLVGLHRRRRRAEHDERARVLRADDRDVAAVVARALVLLVRGVVLLVDDDQAEPSSGANTADRVPMTTSTSPRRMRCH